MKISSQSKIESPTKELLTIEIEFNPNDPNEEGAAALVATLVDLLNRNRLLAEALEDLEDTP